MKMGMREIRRRVKNAASALIARMDLAMLYGEEVVDSADEETQGKMVAAQKEIVKRMRA